MNDQTPADKPTPGQETTSPSERRISFERLRERTDELELIVSGLTVFALFAAPDLILSLWQRTQFHLEGQSRELLATACEFAIGLSYALAIAFLFHIVVRAYWIGLIGLKSVFPGGIRWRQTGFMGPIARSMYQRRLPDIDTAIDAADRLASVIFALSGLVAITIGWISVLIGVLTLLTSLLGALLDLDQSTRRYLALGFAMSIAGLAIVTWLLDARLAVSRPRLQSNPKFRLWVERGLRVANAVIPQRLILPVQLTLQSNLPTRRFQIALIVTFAVVPLIGLASLLAQERFAPLSNYAYLQDADAESGLRSAYYEDLRGPEDVQLALPMIPSDRTGDAFLRLFLPHLPSRDNALLRDRCPQAPAANDPKLRIACLAGLWQLQLDGRAVTLANFLPAERRDQGLRGLQGYLPLAGLQPGRHDLHLVWHAEGAEEGPHRRRAYHIPFWFSPAYELAVDDAAAPPSH